ncbi:MAG TPA: GNAT family N-acetyltransferase [Caulifigura sp.]|jgi:GNAT superfamily N-acetyltransferase|nr:GNAT family N-acetyltransferase [Caulifigura sp.]
MTAEWTIRRATVDDLPEVLRLVRALARYEKLEDQFVATESDFREALFGATPRAEIWLGFAGTRAVGYVTFFHTFSTFLGKPGLYLEDLFVEESERGRGYGSRLFRFVAQLARERGCGRMEWSALDWNEPALKFYDAMGAKLLDDWRLLRLDAAGLERL